MATKPLNGYGGEKAYRQAEAQRRIAERKYYSLLSRIARDLRKILQSATSPEMATMEIENYANSPTFNAMAQSIAGQMVTASLVGSRRTWREAAAESSHGRIIYEALKKETENTQLGIEIDNIVQRNARLIRSVPRHVAEKLTKLAWEQYRKGIRPEETMQKMLKMAPNLTQNKARLIARTETAKAASALMEARCEALGMPWYIWRSCEDERVRDAHAFMNGILCRWDDPPNPEKLFGGTDSGGGYHPGGIYNCRCVAYPIISESEIPFPIRVHSHGKVRTVNSLADLKRFAA